MPTAIRLAKPSRAIDASRYPRKHDDAVEQHHGQRAEQPQLLAHDRVDEVGVAHRQVRERLLRALQVALADEAARADRDLGLDDLVARAARVLLGVQERLDAPLLVVVQVIPQLRQRHRHGAVQRQHRQQHDDARARPGQQSHEQRHEPPHAAGEEEQRHVEDRRQPEQQLARGMPAQKNIATSMAGKAGRGAEVRLLGHEHERHQRDEHRRHPPPHLPQVEPRVVEEAREHERGRELRDLRGLELERPELDPAFGAQAFDADHEHGDEPRRARRVERPRDRVVER
jgi:hypothetical protein